MGWCVPVGKDKVDLLLDYAVVGLVEGGDVLLVDGVGVGKVLEEGQVEILRLSGDAPVVIKYLKALNHGVDLLVHPVAHLLPVLDGIELDLV